MFAFFFLRITKSGNQWAGSLTDAETHFLGAQDWKSTVKVISSVSCLTRESLSSVRKFQIEHYP